ncbi:calcium-dependent phosphotriesterase [Massarina eburnea CBS 473.64]|uniref:Calcium-dependent phosphotriesterase n=1 Tax=Massarina eburnea CBS 473.64 TaxID=1395130 RepID=A0A6A6RZU7_9PLEO|nr:calcium-dependent phosphotriesterase [Massarina eburnea CBS 473.64]
MLRGLFATGSVLAVLFASVYQLWLKEVLTVTVGVGRVIQNIDEFPYQCRRLEHKRLEACEDLWLDNEARVLYAACAGTMHRRHWSPSIAQLNVSGRRPGGGELIALDIDAADKDGFFPFHALETSGYTDAVGGTELDLVGFDVEVIDSSTIHFYLVNLRPPVDDELKYVDASKIGANSTIEIFEFRKGETSMKHLRTISSPEIISPNNIAALGGGALVFSNDHSGKVGLRRELDPILGGGNIIYCSSLDDCHTASPPTPNLRFPNGLAKGTDGRIYVPSTVDGKIYVYEVEPNTNNLDHVDTIEVGMPLDNINVDANGDMWVPGVPNILETMKTTTRPLEVNSPATLFRVGRNSGEWKVEKVLEDGEAKVMSLATTVAHDVKTGRLFVGAALAPYLVVCDPE